MAQHKRGLQGAIWFTLACTTIDMDGAATWQHNLTGRLLAPLLPREHLRKQLGVCITNAGPLEAAEAVDKVHVHDSNRAQVAILRQLLHRGPGVEKGLRSPRQGNSVLAEAEHLAEDGWAVITQQGLGRGLAQELPGADGARGGLARLVQVSET